VTRDLRYAEPFLNAQPTHFGYVDGWLAPTIDAALFGCRNAFELPLTSQVGLELSKDAKHIQKRFASGVARVDWLLGSFECDVVCFEIMDNVLQILDAASETIDPGNNKRVTWPQKREQVCQLRSSPTSGCRSLFRPHDITPGRPERCLLDGEILVDAGNSGVTVMSHEIVSLGFRPLDDSVLNIPKQAY
jgi:hypothetical protein